MKKILVVILISTLLVGCSSEKKIDSTNRNTSSNTNTNVDSNTNTNTNSNSNEGKYVVNFYLFHSETCSHCQSEIRWLNSIEKDYPYLKVHYYEASKNVELYEKVKSELDISSDSVPLTIIGNDYYVGFSDAKGRKFLRIIKEESTKDRCDVVDAIINNKNVTECIEHNKRD